MKTLMIPLCAVGLIFAGTSAGIANDKSNDKSSAANQSKEVQQQTKTMTRDRTTKTATDTIYGKIDTFDAGKSIKVTVPGKMMSTRSFDLNSKNWTYHVAQNLKPGQWVEVTEKTDNNGHKTLTIEPSSKKYSSRMEGSSKRY